MPYCHYQTFREFVKISPLCYKAIDFDGTELNGKRLAVAVERVEKELEKKES